MALRLDKYLSHLGFGSRSAVQALIRAGRAQADGICVRDPGTDVTGKRVTVDGKAVAAPGHRHIMLRKPAGILTAAEDRRAATVMDLLPPLYKKLGCMPVGRLDKDTTGLLLLTTDGTLGHRLISPKRHVDKTYLAHLDRDLPPDAAARFSQGLDLGDFRALPASLSPLSPRSARVTVQEGKYHQVKRMFLSVGCAVTALERETFGPLALDDSLPPGGWRELTEEEAGALYRAAGLEEKHG